MNNPFALIIPVLLALCACYPSHYRTAKGAGPQDLSKIRVHDDITITRINGERLRAPRWGLVRQEWDDFFLTPGRVDVELSYFRQGAREVVSSSGYQSLSLDLRPGQIVSLCPGVKRNRLGRVTGWEPYAMEFPKFDPDRMWWITRANRPRVPEECK